MISAQEVKGSIRILTLTEFLSTHSEMTLRAMQVESLAEKFLL
jgi:hypothetical protein